MSFLGRLLVKNVYDGSGNLMPPEPAIQVIGGTVTDNPALGATVITFAASSTTWQNDLVNSTGTNQYVSSLSYSSAAGGGAIAINGTGTSLAWAANNTGPLLSQTAASGNGATTRISAQSSSGANGSGGALVLTGGDLNGSGHRGSVQLCLGAASSVTLVEVAEPIVGNNVVALCKGSALTSTQMPANSGNGVIYIANASSTPTVGPVGGSVLYSSGGVIYAWASGFLFNAGVSTPTIGQPSGAGAGTNLQIGAQPGGGAGAGGTLVLSGGSGGASNAGGLNLLGGGTGGVIAVKPDNSTVALQLGLATTDAIVLGVQSTFNYAGLNNYWLQFGKGVTSPAPLISQVASTSGNGATLTVQAQAGGGASGNGGILSLQGGGRAGSGINGPVQICVGVGSVIVEAANPIVGNNVVALCNGSALTSTQMPANSGNGVIYIADAAGVPTVGPVSGSVLYSTSGYLTTFALGIAFNAAVSSPVISFFPASGATTALTLQGQSAGGTNDGGAVVLTGGQKAGASQVDGSVKVTTPLNIGELEFSPVNGAQTLTNAQSDANVINLGGAASGSFTINYLRRISDTSLLFVSNRTSQACTIAYLTGGTASVATGTSAVICSNGTNLVKIMAGT